MKRNSCIGHTCCPIHRLRRRFRRRYRRRKSCIFLRSGTTALDSRRRRSTAICSGRQARAVTRRLSGCTAAAAWSPIDRRHAADLPGLGGRIGPAAAMSSCWSTASGRAGTARCARSTASISNLSGSARSDAYGALWYLQAQPFVRGDRIGLVGWSQGGGATLFAIGRQSPLRPSNPPPVDFRAAVAFYPAPATKQRQTASWRRARRCLVLMGAEDVWTPMPPCQQFLDGAIGRGTPVEIAGLSRRLSRF